MVIKLKQQQFRSRKVRKTNLVSISGILFLYQYRKFWNILRYIISNRTIQTSKWKEISVIYQEKPKIFTRKEGNSGKERKWGIRAATCLPRQQLLNLSQRTRKQSIYRQLLPPILLRLLSRVVQSETSMPTMQATV